MGVYIPYTRLPSAYQEVEYIQNSGNLYINSGYAPNQDTKAEFKFSNWTEIGSYDVFGTDRGFANSGFTLLSTVPCYGNQTVDTSKNVADGNLHTITLGKDGYVVDGELITTFNTQTFTSLNLYLFALNRNNSPREYAHYRFYYMKIWNNGTLVRDFVPCYRKSDSVIGLYDLVNNQFYTNSGSGSFTKGSNVYTSELKNAYIGEHRVPGANTLAYYPLDSTNTVNDMSGHSYHLINNGNVSFGTYGGVDCAYFGTTAPYGLKNTAANIISGDYTFLAWINGDTSNSGTGNPRIFGGNNDWWLLWERTSEVFHPAFQGTSAGVAYTSGWHLLAFTGNISTKSFTPYKDGVQLTGGTGNSGTSYSGILIGTNEGNNSNTLDRYCGYMSAVIFENRQRTAQEISNYYNQTKGDYLWKPGANTVAYYPLTSSTTVNDKSGNNRNLTNSNVSFGTQFGVDCAYISGNADSSHSVSKYLYGNITGLPTGNSARTYSFWVYNNNASVPSVADDMYIFQGIAGTNRMVFAHGGGVDGSGLTISQRGAQGAFGASIRKQRCHNVITYDGTKFEWYVNGVSRGTWTYTINTGSNKFSIFGASENPYWNAFNGGMSELILENKARTAQEVATYYNSTKSQYGIS